MKRERVDAAPSGDQREFGCVGGGRLARGIDSERSASADHLGRVFLRKLARPIESPPAHSRTARITSTLLGGVFSGLKSRHGRVIQLDVRGLPPLRAAIDVGAQPDRFAGG